MQLATAANNLGVLGISYTPEIRLRLIFFYHNIGQINNLIQGVATAAGRAMSLLTVGSPPPPERTGMISESPCFSGRALRIDFLPCPALRLEEQTSQLSRHLPLAHLQQRDNDKKGMSLS